MTSNEHPQKRWKSNGRKFAKYDPSGRPVPQDVNTGNDPGDDPEYLVNIQETCRSIDMDRTEPDEVKPDKTNKSKNKKHPYGMPIDARLAVALIAAWQKKVDGLKEKLFEEKRELSLNREERDSFKALLKRSSAITVDKNIILKTLSQPGCEGLRFYLCMKSEPSKDEKETDFLSLVTVGVNEYGRDLHYSYDDKNGIKGMKALKASYSMLSEYNSPPPPPYNISKAKSFIEDSFDKRYAILKYALDEMKLQNKKKRK